MTEVPHAASLQQPDATGIASIDSVLDLVAGLDDKPVAEHAEIFESAHTTLRRALDDQAQPGAVHPA